MSQSLDIHVATVDERRAAHANVFDVWPRGSTLQEHVARRDASPLHLRGRWCVGCLEDRVVTSLASHAVTFRLRGRSIPGIAIGSVHTLVQHRGRGFAPRLLDWAERYEHQHGARLSVLFSDIKPDYYARLGYRRCPARRGWADPQSLTARAPAATDAYRLVPFAVADGRDEMTRIYDADYSRELLWIDHSGEYGMHLSARRPEDEYNWLFSAASDARVGYVRLTHAGELTKLADYAVVPHADEEAARQALFQLAIARATARGAKRVGGWFPDRPSSRACFKMEDRPDEITMFKPLDPSVVLDPQCLHAADRFVEIDHV